MADLDKYLIFKYYKDNQLLEQKIYWEYTDENIQSGSLENKAYKFSLTGENDSYDTDLFLQIRNEIIDSLNDVLMEEIVLPPKWSGLIIYNAQRITRTVHFTEELDFQKINKHNMTLEFLFDSTLDLKPNVEAIKSQNKCLFFSVDNTSQKQVTQNISHFFISIKLDRYFILLNYPRLALWELAFQSNEIYCRRLDSENKIKIFIDDNEFMYKDFIVEEKNFYLDSEMDIKYSFFTYLDNTGLAKTFFISNEPYDPDSLLKLPVLKKIPANIPELKPNEKFLGYFTKPNAKGIQIFDENLNFLLENPDEFNSLSFMPNEDNMKILYAGYQLIPPSTDEEIEALPGIRAVEIGPYSSEGNGDLDKSEYYKIVSSGIFNKVQTNILQIGESLFYYDEENKALVLEFQQQEESEGE